MVFNTNGLLYPDSVVGTDSHTTMIDGLGVAGWGVGGIEAEAAMLGQVERCCGICICFIFQLILYWLTFHCLYEIIIIFWYYNSILLENG